MFVCLLMACLCYCNHACFKQQMIGEMNMITKTKELKIYGYLMIFFGILDLAYLAIDISEISTLLGDYSKAIVIFTYAFLGLCLLITLAKFWMGRQALCYAKGTGKGTSHIKLAKIGIAFGVLVLVSDAVGYLNGTASYSEAVSTITSLIVMHSYYKAAKACL